MKIPFHLEITLVKLAQNYVISFFLFTDFYLQIIVIDIVNVFSLFHYLIEI